MSRIGQLIEKVSSGVFSFASIQPLCDKQNVDVTIAECDESPQEILKNLPCYLHFLDRSRPRGETWQEIQCTHIGLAFHLVRMMNHRPALLSSTLFPPSQGSPRLSETRSFLQRSINISVDSAKEIIEIASNAIFQRATCIRNDASVANYILSACVTLLFNVLSSSVTAAYARHIFVSVEQGIHCLDQTEHMGPITGKAISMDIMKSAKDALALSNSDQYLEDDLAEIFPWLK
ncbi:hypothetical protein N7488_012449 [Penicillium malachiteum]|nr:hypothetical protein N7488_012449 [Penicillium malachiteum]